MAKSKNVNSMRIRAGKGHALHFYQNNVKNDKSLVSVFNEIKNTKSFIKSGSIGNDINLEFIERILSSSLSDSSDNRKHDIPEDTITESINNVIKNKFIRYFFDVHKNGTLTLKDSQNIAQKSDIAKYAISQNTIKKNSQDIKEVALFYKRTADVVKNITKSTEIDSSKLDELKESYETLEEEINTLSKDFIKQISSINEGKELSASSKDWSSTKQSFLDSVNNKNIDTINLSKICNLLNNFVQINNLVFPATAVLEGTILENAIIAIDENVYNTCYNVVEENVLSELKINGSHLGTKQKKINTTYKNGDVEMNYSATSKTDGKLIFSYKKGQNKEIKEFNFSAKKTTKNSTTIQIYNGYLYPYIDDKYRNAYLNVFSDLHDEDKNIIKTPENYILEARKKFALMILAKSFQGYTDTHPDYLVINTTNVGQSNVKIYKIEDVFNNIQEDMKNSFPDNPPWTQVKSSAWIPNVWVKDTSTANAVHKRIATALQTYYSKKILVTINKKYLT